MWLLIDCILVKYSLLPILSTRLMTYIHKWKTCTRNSHSGSNLRMKTNSRSHMFFAMRPTGGSVGRCSYHKSTLSGRHVNFEMIYQRQIQTWFFRTLFDRASRISSEEYLDEDCEKITIALLDSGCLNHQQ